jgi:hypothetical protein
MMQGILSSGVQSIARLLTAARTNGPIQCFERDFGSRFPLVPPYRDSSTPVKRLYFARGCVRSYTSITCFTESWV